MPLTRLLDRAEPRPILERQRHLAVNVDDDEVDETWHHDEVRTALGVEPPGPPAPDGVWETACRLVTAYEFSDPRIVRGVYDAGQPLLGRDLLLEGRFAVLRFYMGVRITRVIDEHRRSGSGTSAEDRVWGWAYETLEGHLERGRMSYEVIKHQGNGEVEFVVRGFSRAAETVGPLTTLGWRLFGRRTQLRFYRSCLHRLSTLVAARTGMPDPVPPRRTVDGLVLAPSDAASSAWHRLSIRRHQPG